MMLQFEFSAHTTSLWTQSFCAESLIHRSKAPEVRTRIKFREDWIFCNKLLSNFPASNLKSAKIIIVQHCLAIHFKGKVGTYCKIKSTKCFQLQKGSFCVTNVTNWDVLEFATLSTMLNHYTCQHLEIQRIFLLPSYFWANWPTRNHLTCDNW